MTSSNRRSFLAMLGAGTAGAALQSSIGRALAIPANQRTGTIRDIEHIVVLMQENRSFDHYYGTLSGVRGFGDPRAVRLPNGAPVWQQPSGTGTLLPFHPDAPDLGLQFIQDLPHDWDTTHAAANGGRWDGWVAAKGTTTMAHLERSDIPFHYALADAFTICDAYHCSLLGPTDPNRYYMWTGWVGNDGTGGGPVIDNAEAGYSWTTFPERLQQQGISWKLYQDTGTGLNKAGSWGWTQDAYIGNYGDNSLLYFTQYQNAPDGSPLAERARTGTTIADGQSPFALLQADVQNGTLPAVSWIVAPEAYTEHPNWPANYGAWFIAQVLDILTARPEVWSKTALFITYDENDGFFDHVVSPTVPHGPRTGASTVSTENEIFAGAGTNVAGPYGLGVRVPMLVVSPWSRGGWVNSQLFDHTSIIRFIEQRFADTHPGLRETNISPWRRAVCGDLTTAFDFRTPNDKVGALPSVSGYKPPTQTRHPDYKPVPPLVASMPKQETGVRRARALPYRLSARAEADATSVTLRFGNHGDQTAVFQVRSADPLQGPRNFTVSPGCELSDRWTTGLAPYALDVHGPNGFLRSFAGGGRLGLSVQATEHPDAESLVLELSDGSGLGALVRLHDAYSDRTSQVVVPPGHTVRHAIQAGETFGWYDVTLTIAADPTFRVQLAGHVETGRDSITDPGIGLIA
ncbi:phospholipase C, phosphocholine-specific [Acetobacteraceae bacterium KSS8]|uniref:phospholipase C n=1 Tax=Endosaccharibacter trunci TaxID=2812733 RepID=A0ABT1W4W8_9PROT|nr:phospholipase C, phosphocholine-specific [Acetobacteraceae bacterium KSS8]